MPNISDRFFFFIQNIFKNSTFLITPRIRGFIYSYFLQKVGKNLIIHDNVLIKYPSRIIIGDNLCINQNSYIEAKGGLEIGHNVMMGAGISIATSTHVFSNIQIPMLMQGVQSSCIKIEDDVWIGFNAVILNGITIQKGSIIGANATVTKDVESMTIVGGSPAKVIRHRL